MHSLSVVPGTTDVILQVFIEDTRLDNGGGLTGLVYNTASLTCYYFKAGAAAGGTQISLIDTTVGTHADGGFKVIDGTNLPGLYELQIPDACVAAGFGRTTIMLKGAANMAVTNILISEASTNVARISGDATAADNLELDYDGTGYAKTASTIGTATTVTNMVTANVTQISGDATAADNLELDYDGTGYSKPNSSIGEVLGSVAAVTDPVSANVVSIDATTRATLVDNIWDEDLAGHTTLGTSGKALTLAAACPSAATVADAVWDEARAGHVAGGSFGEGVASVQGNVTGSVGSVTGNVGGNVAGSVGSVTGNVGGNVAGSVASVTNMVTANVTQISGDSTAADNLEATFDGTGYTDPKAPARQEQVDNLAVGTAAISAPAESRTLTTYGAETNSYTNTEMLNGVYHQLTDNAGTLDMYYQFDIGADGVPVNVTWHGRMTGTNDTILIYAYDWDGADWEQVGSRSGVVNLSANDSTNTYNLLRKYVGSGANDGKVRIRFAGTGLTSAKLYVDYLYLSYSLVRQTIGYSNGAIWVDTLNGAAGTTNFTNGTADNPVDNWADALTLSGSLNLRKFQIANNSSITLSGDSSELELVGKEWELDLNGQAIDESYFEGAEVTGTGTGAGSDAHFHMCKFGTCTLPRVTAHMCAFTDRITLSNTGAYYFVQCYSGVAGTSTPFVDFGGVVGDVYLNMRHYSGGIRIENMSAGDRMSLEGNGQLQIDATCTGGTVAIRGHFTVTDYASGAVTLSDDARFAASELVDDMWDEALAGHATTGTAGKALSDVASAAAPTAGEIADAVWDEPTAGHATDGTFGKVSRRTPFCRFNG